MTVLQIYAGQVPAWALDGDGDAIFRTFARLIDHHSERLRLGVVARYPRQAVEHEIDGALELIGQDRGMVRGRAETALAYADRLVAWRYPRGHRVRGSAIALLEQVAAYWGGVLCQTIDSRGRLYERETNGNLTVDRDHPWTWDALGAGSGKRFWLIVDATPFAAVNPGLGTDALWGGALGAGDYTIGQQGVTPDDIATMRGLLYGRRPWRPSGTQPEWLIFALTPWRDPGVRTWDDSFDYTFGDPWPLNPDAAWATWSKEVDGVRVASRDSRFRYVSLDPDHNNTYAGDASAFALRVTMVDGTVHTLDPDAGFATSITSPTGETLTGDPTVFHTSLRLLDDGDPAS